MISEKMEKAFLDQINAEQFSSYLYLSMYCWLSSNGLPGFATWMKGQVQEEDFHANKMLDYLLERGGKAELQAIDRPRVEWSSVYELWQDVVDHEAKVTSLINGLVDCALEERDHASSFFLQWYVEEQVEEEASVGEVLDKLNLIGDNSSALFALDMELGKRVFSEPEE